MMHAQEGLPARISALEAWETLLASIKFSDLPGTSKRPPKVDLLMIVLIGLLLQAGLSSRLKHPTYMDAYYYTTNGSRLAGGQGLTEMIIWQFLDEPEGFPAPSHTYWMPLPSLLAAGGYKLTGGFRGAQMPFWILAGLLPLLSYVISHSLAGQRWQAWTAALLTASGGFYINFFGQPSTFAPFAWAGALCLLALARASDPIASPLWWFLAGLMAGLGHLTRADGVLLLAVGIGLWVLLTAVARRPRDELGTASLQDQSRNVLWLFVGYLMIMGGWFARTWIISGRLLSTVGTQTIFLTTYDDLFAYGRSFGLTHLLNWGWGNILRSKLQGMSVAAQTFIAVSCFIFLTPFVLWGWNRLRKNRARRHLLRPVTWYTLSLFGIMSVVFTFPGERGGLFHSSAALWPWFMALAAIGIDSAVGWAATRLPHWQPERAKRIFAGLFVGVAFATSLAIGVIRAPDNTDAEVYVEIGAQLQDAAVVMVGDAPAFYYHTGIPAISVPNEPVEVLLQAARQYGVTHLILDKDRPQPLASLYAGELSDPALQWIGDIEDRKLYAVRGAAQ
jgi:hypothetical protein